MLHLFRSAASKATTVALIGLLVVGVLIGAVRIALPFADMFRSQLEERLSEALGLELRVSHLGLRLAGHVPQLRLQDVELLDPESGRPQLSLEQLRVDLNLAASLRELAPQIESVTLVGAHLIIKRRRDGTITVVGLEGMEGDDPETMTFFLGNGRFLLADSELRWIDEMAGASKLDLSDVQIHFENTGSRHRVGVLARLFGDQETKLRLVGDMRGEPGRPAHWNGELFLHWQGRDLDQVLEGRLPEGLHLGTSAVDVENWSRVEGGEVAESLNRIAATGLSLWSRSREETAAPLRVDKLRGLLRWRRAGDGWGLEVKDLALTRSGTRRPTSDLGIRYRAADDGSWSVQGGNQFLDLGDTSDLLARLPGVLPDALEMIDDIHPDGELHDLRFRVEHHPQLPLQWAASGHIRDLSLDAHQRIPAIQGLTAEIAANEREGTTVIAGDGLTLGLPRLLPDPIKLDEAAGEIRWRREADGELRVTAGEIVADNADIATRSRFSISLPGGGGSPFLDLHTEFRDTQTTSVRRYVPSKILRKKLVSWLDRAFLGGTIPSGALLFRGVLADFPFDEQQGRFKVLLEVQDCILDFHRDWPRLEDVTAEVRFENRELEILVSEARFLDSDVIDTSASIPNLNKADAIEIRGRVEGKFADALRALDETPLRKRLGALASAVEAKGVSRLNLDMAIPLHKDEREVPLRLAGELTWPGPAALAVADQDIELTDLAGTLRFTDRSVEAESIAARLWNQPVRLRVDTRERAGNAGRSTRIRASGRFPTSVLARQFPTKSWGLLKGRTRLNLLLDIGNADMSETVPPIEFELTSDLTGLAVELPAPMGKEAEGTRRLRFSGRLAPKHPLHIQGGYGDLGINLGLAKGGNDEFRLARGTFNLGGDATPLPKDEGLYLSGSIDNLDLQAWLNWSATRQASAGGDRGGGVGLRSADVRVQRLLMPGAALNDVRFDLERRSSQWEARLEANELAGKVAIPHRIRDEPVRIRLQRLDLKAVLAHEGKEDQTLADRQRADPRQAHTLDLSIEQLMWGENPLGSVTLHSQAAPDGLDFTDVAFDGPLMSIQGAGSWKQADRGPRTRLSVTAKGSDVGEFMRSLEFKSQLHKAPAEVGLDLEWPGGPGQPAVADLAGRIEVEVGAGSLLDVEPGVGRMLGILNLEALQRRLTLDFSDLFQRGYAFEKITGELEIGAGKATIKELVIEGPSADISIAGSTNLVDQEFNQIVTVTPSIGTGVAIASAVAGGPLVGAAVYLADRVTGGAVDKLGRHQYVLSGPWAAPEMRRGKLGADSEPEATRGKSLEEPGRAGASGPRDTKHGQPGDEPRQETKARKSSDRPTFFRDDENLFLE